MHLRTITFCYISTPKLSLVVIYWRKPFMTLLFRIYFVVLINSQSYFSSMFEKAQWILFVMDITSNLMYGKSLYYVLPKTGSADHKREKKLIYKDDQFFF